MDHKLVNRFHRHQRPPMTDMAGLSAPPSHRTYHFVLNWFLLRFGLGWRL
jgi:hypothetical protein